MLAALEHVKDERTTVSCDQFYTRGRGDLRELEGRLYRSVAIPLKIFQSAV